MRPLPSVLMLLATIVMPGAPLVAQTTTSSAQSQRSGSLGSVNLTRAVRADGKPLAAGAYQIRLGDEVPAVTGQSAGSERWVEFLQSGTVAGREVATVISAADMPKIAKSPQPAPNATRVDTLAGGQYVRIWINRQGVNYLINLRAR